MSSPAVEILHEERVPAHGVLMIPGRGDLEVISALEHRFRSREITWLIEESAEFDPAVRSFLEQCGHGAMYSALDQNLAAAGQQLKAAITAGKLIIHVPGLSAARQATPCHIPGPHLEALCALGLPILPIATEFPREVQLSIERPCSAQPVLNIALPVAADPHALANFWQRLLEASNEVFARKTLFKGSLGSALLAGLMKHGSRHQLIDGSDDSHLPYSSVLAASLALSRLIREETDQLRVAIVLPPGKAGLIANLAVIFAGKIPVNLNFTASHEAIKSSIRQSGVDRFITADPFVRKVSSFPWPPNRDLIFIERVMPTLKKKAVFWGAIARVTPAPLLARILGLHRRRGDDEALLLFTSGSSGEPKGVPLSHRNVLGNVCQFATRLDLPDRASILGSLPLFHSFGCTVTLWFPVIEGIDLVTYPSPLETKRLAELIALHQVDVLLATPTFLRGYMKRVDPSLLSSLRLVVTGAEKLPVSLADAFEEKFAIRPQEGYGLTETSPATNVNLPDPPILRGVAITSSRNGSVGQMLPGLAIRMTDPATGAESPLDQQGIIWFKGPNIFNGYLNHPEKSAEVLVDGWFRTGDVGRVDRDGFLYIEGRISRFSKIAGEMVPHESVEAVINEVLGLDGDTERRIAIVGVPDEAKGEAIILLSTVAGPAREQECIDLRYKLLDRGVSSLWCPRTIVPIAEIPVLASGKLDIKACEQAVGKLS